MNEPIGSSELPTTDITRLKLYIEGNVPGHARIIDTLQDIGLNQLRGLYELEIVDLLSCETECGNANIPMTPMLIREHPHPVCRMMGDLSEPQRVLYGLGLADRPDR